MQIHKRTHAHTHTRTHARTHARTHKVSLKPAHAAVATSCTIAGQHALRRRQAESKQQEIYTSMREVREQARRQKEDEERRMDAIFKEQQERAKKAGGLTC